MAFHKREPYNFAGFAISALLLHSLISILCFLPVCGLFGLNIVLGLSYQNSERNYDIIEFFTLDNENATISGMSYNLSDNVSESKQNTLLPNNVRKNTNNREFNRRNGRNSFALYFEGKNQLYRNKTIADLQGDTTNCTGSSLWRDHQESKYFNKKDLNITTEGQGNVLRTGPVKSFPYNVNTDNGTSIHTQPNNTTGSKNNKVISKMMNFRRRKLRFHQKVFRQERRMRKLHQLSKTKNMTITCPELNNITFTNAPPFDILGIPDCAKHVLPKMR